MGASSALIAFVLVGLLVANLRRSRTGRRLIAVRTNERAAASLGVSVFGVKLYAFGVASALAAIAGILLGFTANVVTYGRYNPFQSINSVGHAVIGGLGYVLSMVVSAPNAIGGLGTRVIQDWLGLNQGNWDQLVGRRDPVRDPHRAPARHRRRRRDAHAGRPATLVREAAPRRPTGRNAAHSSKVTRRTGDATDAEGAGPHRSLRRGHRRRRRHLHGANPARSSASSVRTARERPRSSTRSRASSVLQVGRCGWTTSASTAGRRLDDPGGGCDARSSRSSSSRTSASRTTSTRGPTPRTRSSRGSPTCSGRERTRSARPRSRAIREFELEDELGQAAGRAAVRSSPARRHRTRGGVRARRSSCWTSPLPDWTKPRAVSSPSLIRRLAGPTEDGRAPGRARRRPGDVDV